MRWLGRTPGNKVDQSGESDVTGGQMNDGRHPVEARLYAARNAFDQADDKGGAAALDLALASVDAGQPSVAEPVLRSLISHPEVGQAAIRSLVMILVDTARPSEARELCQALDGDPESQLVREWLLADDGDVTAFDRARTALNDLPAPTFLHHRLVHQTAAMCAPAGSRDPLFDWIAWLRDHQDSDPDALDHLDAWTTAVEFALELGALPNQLLGVPGHLLSLASPLPHGHPLKLRTFLVVARALLPTNHEVSVVLTDHALRHVDAIDPLLHDSICAVLEPMSDAVGRPTSMTVGEGLRAIALSSRSGFGLASDTDFRGEDLFVCLMKTSTAQEMLRVFSERELAWASDSVGLSVSADATEATVIVTFASVHPDSAPWSVPLSNDEADAIVAFAAHHGFLPRRAPAVGRNDPCPCGSGRKYKRCCGA